MENEESFSKDLQTCMLAVKTLLNLLCVRDFVMGWTYIFLQGLEGHIS